jgi:quinol monooxygenase YgiN
MSSTIRVVAHAQALPGQEAALQSVLETFVTPTRAEAGCIAYDFFIDADDSSKFTFIEEWVSREALDEHMQTPHMQAGFAALEGKLAGPPWIQVLRNRA